MAMQAGRQRERPPLGVLFDSSLNGGIDQVLALAMLFHLDAARRIRIVSLSTGSFNLKNAAFLDAVARFYSDGRGGGYGPGRGMLPIGMTTAGVQNDVAPPMITAALARVGDDGSPLYPHTVRDLNDTADAAALIRNALTAFDDQNAAVVLAGSPTNLLAVLELPDGANWVTKKARILSVAAGRFDGGDADPVVGADVAGFRKLLADWPTPIVMAGRELNSLTIPGPSVEGIALGAPNHPVVDAYRASKPMSNDAPTQTLAAVLHAIYPEEDYFELSEPGTVQVQDDGVTQFTASPRGRHHYLTVRPDQTESIVQTYVTLLTDPPPPPREDAESDE